MTGLPQPGEHPVPRLVVLWRFADTGKYTWLWLGDDREKAELIASQPGGALEPGCAAVCELLPQSGSAARPASAELLREARGIIRASAHFDLSARIYGLLDEIETRTIHAEARASGAQMWHDQAVATGTEVGDLRGEVRRLRMAIVEHLRLEYESTPKEALDTWTHDAPACRLAAALGQQDGER